MGEGDVVVAAEDEQIVLAVGDGGGVEDDAICLSAVQGAEFGLEPVGHGG